MPTPLTDNSHKPVFPKFSLGQTLILMLLVSFATVGALAISPALPPLTRDLNISKQASQQIIILYMVGFALGNLIYAPLANRHGRKPVMIWCLVISACACLFGGISGYLGSYYTLITSRFVMALAASGCLKISYNIAADILHGNHLTRMTSLFTVALAIAPPISIAIGGGLTQYLGWESISFFLALYAVALIILTLYIPETLREKDLHAMHLTHIVKTFLRTLKGPFMITGSLIIGCMISTLYLFGTEAPFISEDIIGLSPYQFGLLSLLPYFGMLVGGILGTLLAHHVKTSVLLFSGLLLFFASSLSLLLLFSKQMITSWTLFIPSAFIFLGMSLVFTCGISITMSHAKDKSYGSSLMNFINLTFSTLVVVFLGSLTFTHLISYPLLLLALALLATLLSVIIKLKKRDL